MVYCCYLGCSHYTGMDPPWPLHTRMHARARTQMHVWICECVKLPPHLSYMQSILRISVLFLFVQVLGTVKFLFAYKSPCRPPHPNILITIQSPFHSLGKLRRCCWVSPCSFVFLSVFSSSSQAVSCILISQVGWDVTGVKSQRKGSFTPQCHRPANLITSLTL